MSKVVKSVRIDEEMLDIIERYKKEMKRMFGFKVSTSEIISSAIVFGFDENLKILRMLINGSLKPADPSEEIVITDEARKLCNDYNELRLAYELGEEDE